MNHFLLLLASIPNAGYSAELPNANSDQFQWAKQRTQFYSRRESKSVYDRVFSYAKECFSASSKTTVISGSFDPASGYGSISQKTVAKTNSPYVFVIKFRPSSSQRDFKTQIQLFHRVDRVDSNTQSRLLESWARDYAVKCDVKELTPLSRVRS